MGRSRRCQTICELDEHGDTGAGQDLRRVIDTLISGTGEFAESDVWLFSADTLGLVDALVEARIGSIPPYTEAEWRNTHVRDPSP